MSKLSRRKRGAKRLLLNDSTDDFKEDNLTKSQDVKKLSQTNPPNDNIEIGEENLVDNIKNKENVGEKKMLPNCPFCCKVFSNCQPSSRSSHLKSCARQKGISTEKLFEVVNLERKQAIERKELGLRTPSPVQPKPRRKPEPRKEVEQGGADPDLALALALSISAQQSVNSTDDPCSDIPAVTCPGGGSPSRQSTAHQSESSTVIPKETSSSNKTESVTRMWLPQASQQPVKRRRRAGAVRPPTILEMRSRDDRVRITGERVGAILYPDNPGSPEYRTRSWQGARMSSQRLLEIQDDSTRLWIYSSTQDSLAPSQLVTTELWEYFKPAPSSQNNIQESSKPHPASPTPHHNLKRNQLIKSDDPEPSFRKLSQSFLNLLDKQLSSDLKIICKHEISINCHKLIVGARCSPLISEMIVETGELTTNNYIVLTDYTRVVVLVVLEYIYGGVFNLDKITERSDLMELKQLSRRLNLVEMISCLNNLQIEEVDEEDEVQEFENNEGAHDNDVKLQSSFQDVSGTQALDALVEQLSQLHDDDDSDIPLALSSSQNGVMSDRMEVGLEEWDSFCQVLTQKQRSITNWDNCSTREEEVETDEEVDKPPQDISSYHGDDPFNVDEEDNHVNTDSFSVDRDDDNHVNVELYDNPISDDLDDNPVYIPINSFVADENDDNLFGDEPVNDGIDDNPAHSVVDEPVNNVIDDDRLSFGSPLSDYGLSSGYRRDISPDREECKLQSSTASQQSNSVINQQSVAQSCLSSPDMFANSDSEDQDENKVQGHNSPIVLSSNPPSPTSPKHNAISSYRSSPLMNSSQQNIPSSPALGDFVQLSSTLVDLNKTPLSSKRKELSSSPQDRVVRKRARIFDPKEELPTPNKYSDFLSAAVLNTAGQSLLQDPVIPVAGPSHQPDPVAGQGLQASEILETIKSDLVDRVNVKECLEQLLQLTVTLDDLKSTGIGKIVKKLKKERGEVGALSRQVVSEWIGLVDRQCLLLGSQQVNSEQPEEPGCSQQQQHKHCSPNNSNSEQKHYVNHFDNISQQQPCSPVNRNSSNNSNKREHFSLVNSNHSTNRNKQQHSSSSNSIHDNISQQRHSSSSHSLKLSVSEVGDKDCDDKDVEADDSEHLNQYDYPEPDIPELDFDDLDPEPIWGDDDPFQEEDFPLSPEKPKLLKTPVNKRLVLCGGSAAAVTPLPSYETMLSPDLRAELKKFGLKAVPRKKATIFLNHIYHQTHPLVSPRGTVHHPSPVAKNLQKRPAASKMRVPRTTKLIDKLVVQKKLPKDPKPSRPPSPTFLTEESGEFSSSQTIYPDDVPENTFLGLQEEEDVMSQALEDESTLWDKLKAFIKGRPDLHQDILMYTPIPLTQFIKDVKQEGIRCKQEDIITFLDKMSITFRFENKQRQQNKSPKKQAKNVPKKLAKTRQNKGPGAKKGAKNK